MEITDIDRIVQALENLAEPTYIDVSTFLFGLFVFYFTFNDNYQIARTQGRISLYRERMDLCTKVKNHLSILEQVAKETEHPVWNKTDIPEFESLELKYLFSKSVMKQFIKIEELYHIIIESNEENIQNIEISRKKKYIKNTYDLLMKKFDYYLDIFSLPNKIIIINIFYKFFRWLIDLFFYCIKKLLIDYAKKNMPENYSRRN